MVERAQRMAMSGPPGKPGEAVPARALWYAAPGTLELRAVALPPPGPGQLLVNTHYSAVSRGTERLVLAGKVGASEFERMRAPFQEGAFPFPVKYGYAAVGRVAEGPADHAGRLVFCLHPHQDRFVVPTEALAPVPDGVPARRATLAANMETALNALWDSAAGPADRIVVVGGGVVGLLVAYLAARLPGAEVTVVDRDPTRRAVAERLGARFAAPDAAPGDADLVFHASASPAGLATALAAAGSEATVVELSWYGDAPVPAPLGLAFHSRRLTLKSSQVGQVAPSRRPRWSHKRRLAAALALLADPALDALLGEEIAFEDAPRKLPAALAADGPALAPLIRYPDA